MPFDAVTYCTDEDIRIEVGNDFFLVAPRDQRLAIGDDGTIPSASPWVLTSASINFENQQVPAGSIVRLSSKDRSSAANKELYPSGESFAVDSVSGSTLTLRRVGLPSAIGDPAGNPTIDLVAVTFESVTLSPQIKTATDWIRRQIDFDSAADLISDDDLRYLTVYRVLSRIYLSDAALSSSNRDIFLVKAKTYATQAETTLAELQSRRQSNYSTDSISIVPTDDVTPLDSYPYWIY